MITSPVLDIEADPPVSVVPRIHFAGAGGVYLDCGTDRIDVGIQHRIWAMARALRTQDRLEGIREIVPGVNNILVLLDPLVVDPFQVRDHVLSLWDRVESTQSHQRLLEVPVVYGGEGGEDLAEQAARAQLNVHDYVAMHSSALYQVMCIGSTPGFSYMSGLPERLHAPRRSVPRLRIPKGSIVIGGAQAGVMPDAAPSGWHILGRTPLQVFDVTRDAPCLLEPGDTVRFVVQEVLA